MGIYDGVMAQAQAQAEQKKKYADPLMANINASLPGAQNRGAPSLDQQMQAQFRQQQIQQLGQLGQIASGQQQGAGELAVQRQMANAQAAQQAQARMARGAGAGMAQRTSARQLGAVGITGAGMGQQAALGDQMAAQGLMAQIAQGGRGQDIGMATSNLQAQLDQQRMNDMYQLGLLNPLTQLEQSRMQAEAQVRAAEAQKQGMGGPVLGALGSVGAAVASNPAIWSDERLKTDVADGGKDVDAMLDALVAKRYRYKDPKHGGPGERAGVMAQDMAKSRAGAAIVEHRPEGLALDLNKAVSAALAASARLNARLRKVEKKAA